MVLITLVDDENTQQIGDKHFPRNNLLNKMWNRNTIKISYSTMRNIGELIASSIIHKWNENKSIKKCQNKQKLALKIKNKIKPTIEKVIIRAPPAGEK